MKTKISLILTKNTPCFLAYWWFIAELENQHSSTCGRWVISGQLNLKVIGPTFIDWQHQWVTATIQCSSCSSILSRHKMKLLLPSAFLVIYSSNRQLMLCGMYSGFIRVYPLQPDDYSLSSMQAYWALSVHDNQYGHLQHMRWSHDDQFVLTAGDDGNIFSFSLTPPEQLPKSFERMRAKVPSPRVSPYLIYILHFTCRRSYVVTSSFSQAVDWELSRGAAAWSAELSYK